MAISGKRKSSSQTSNKSKFTNKKPKAEIDLSSSAQKRLVKQERQSHRRHAEIVKEAKEIWNSLRQKTNTAEETKAQTDKLSKLIEGKIAEIALQHDASRVVQSVIKFGNGEQRRQVVKELAPRLAEISKTQYAHFCVLGILKHCNRDEICIKLICKALKGQMLKMSVHAVAARVLEELFLAIPARHTNSLKQEFYGPHVALFASVENEENLKKPSLKNYIEKLPEKKELICEHLLQQILQKGIDKALFHFVYFQELLGEYCEVVDGSKIRTMCGSLVDHSVQLINSRSGARVLSLLAIYGTAKDRRRIMKSLKGYTRSSLLHDCAYLSILVLMNVTDDTVSIYKSVLAELFTQSGEEDDSKSSLIELGVDNNASKLFLFFLTTDLAERKKYLDPLERDLLCGETATIDKEPCSKKNPETRRKEILTYLKTPLLEMCEKHADELLRSIAGSRVLKEVYRQFRPKSLVDAVIGVLNSGSDNNLLEDSVGHHTIKHLLLVDTDHDDPLFATAFAEKVNLSKVAKTNRGAFCLCALLKVKSCRDTIQKAVKVDAVKTSLKKCTEKSNAGFSALLSELQKM